MNTARKSGVAAKNTKSNAPIVGGAGGVGIAALATQIEDAALRNLVTVAAPVIAVVLASVFDGIKEVFRNLWRSLRHWWHERQITSYAKKVLKDPQTAPEVKLHAEKAIANAQLATIAFHEKNLNIASELTQVPGKRNARQNAVVADKSSEE